MPTSTENSPSNEQRPTLAVEPLSILSSDTDGKPVPSPQHFQIPVIAQGDLIIHVQDSNKHVTNYETYVSFELTVTVFRSDYPSGKHCVSRRYSEFDWLRKRLVQSFSTVFVPPLPGKHMVTQLERFSVSFIDRRASGLQAFLSRLARHPLLSSSDDTIAFLTFGQESFQAYVSDHPSTGAISSLIFRHLNISATAGTTDPERNHSDSAASQVRSSATCQRSLRLKAAEFSGVLEETTQYMSLAKSLSRLTDTLATQLSALGLDFSELSRELGDWPPDLLPVTNSSTSLSGSSSLLTDTASSTRLDAGVVDTRSESMSMDDEVAPGQAPSVTFRATPACFPALLGEAMRKSAVASGELARRLYVSSHRRWLETAAYADSAKTVLKARKDLEAEYFENECRLQSRLAADNRQRLSPPPASRLSNFVNLGGLIWKEKPVEELVARSNQLQDDLAFANGQVHAEYERWHDERKKETAQALRELCEAHLAYWGTNVDAWRQVALQLQTTESSQLPDLT